MFQNAMLDIAIGLVLMYLMLSLICTVVNEFVSTLSNWRAKTLRSGLEKMIDTPELLETFKKHGLIDSQKTKDGAEPSYLSAQTFVGALVDSLDTGKPIPGIAEIQQAIEKLPVGSNVRDILLANLASANGDITKFRENLANWFDDSMDRISGAYKRYLKWFSLAVGIAVAVILNADSLRVGRALWTDPSLRSEMAEVAKRYVSSCPAPINAAPAPAPANPASPAPNAGCVTPSSDPVSLQKARNDVDAAMSSLRPLPIGWPEKAEGLWWFIEKFFGLLVTGLALSLGAPFWFDLLSKVVNIRGTGDKPERHDEKVAQGKVAPPARPATAGS
jgi:hypothetical protein